MFLLTLVASALIGFHTPVHCTAMPGHPWHDNVWGMAAWPPDRIYLRHCRWTIQERRPAVVIFAHEILHVEHHDWPHPKIYAQSQIYSGTVLNEIRKAKR